MRKASALFPVLAVLIASRCIGGQQATASDAETAKAACIDLCGQALNAAQDLSSGPCLSNEVIAGWVCDVAHTPRTSADDNSTNQCSAYGSTSQHFVEVDENCNFIRGV